MQMLLLAATVSILREGKHGEIEKQKYQPLLMRNLGFVVTVFVFFFFFVFALVFCHEVQVSWNWSYRKL